MRERTAVRDSPTLNLVLLHETKVICLYVHSGVGTQRWPPNSALTYLQHEWAHEDLSSRAVASDDYLLGLVGEVVMLAAHYPGVFKYDKSRLIPSLRLRI